MSDISKSDFIPKTTNYVRQGTGTPVILIHGIAASLHDWDDLIPALRETVILRMLPTCSGTATAPGWIRAPIKWIGSSSTS